MKFECNCTNENEFNSMMDGVHASTCGVNFEVGARLWVTKNDKTIMVEHQISTQDCRDLTENPNEPDWLTAYEVDDENDDDCSCEIFTETVESNIKLGGLKNAMIDFASQCFEKQ